MDDLSRMLEELAAADKLLARNVSADFADLEALLSRRGALLEAIARHSASLPREHVRDALHTSYQAGTRALRHLIVTKHMLATELNHLRQIERLTDALSMESSRSPGALDIHG
jgi:hypothetical protein